MVRAKFVCSENKQTADGNVIRFYATTGDDNPESENSKFFKYTPAGEVVLQTVNEEAAKQFEPGKAYYVDFTPAP